MAGLQFVSRFQRWPQEFDPKLPNLTCVTPRPRDPPQKKNIYIWCRVAASQAPPPMVCPPSPPQARPFALARGVAGLPTAHGTTRQGTRGPLPLPLPFDTQTRMMATMLCTMTSMCYSQCGCWWYLCSYVALGFGIACSLPYLVANRAWLVMFLRKLY